LALALALAGEEGRIYCHGALALDGSVRAARGLAAAVLATPGDGTLLVPADQVAEAAHALGLLAGGRRPRAVAVCTLAEALGFARGERGAGRPVEPARVASDEPDLAEVRGAAEGRAAIERAAITGRGVCLVGPAGSARMMLARRLPGIMPPLTRASAREVAAICSLAGLTVPAGRPFRAPHYTCSETALLGGGTYGRPGEVALAHCGVLFLDELPEFRRGAVEALAAALAAGEVAIHRSTGIVRWPARALVIASAAPCPCGLAGQSDHRCDCAPAAVAAFRARVEAYAKLLTLTVVAVPPAPGGRRWIGEDTGEDTATVRGRVTRARHARALARMDEAIAEFQGDPGCQATRLAAEAAEEAFRAAEEVLP